MRTSTRILQTICAFIGAACIWSAIVLDGQLMAGFVLGSIMFCFAAMLGADHTVNSSRKSRRIYKALAVLTGLPMVVAGTWFSFMAAMNGDVLEGLLNFLKIVVFLVSLLTTAFDNHPVVQKYMRRLGLATPKQE